MDNLNQAIGLLNKNIDGFPLDQKSPEINRNERQSSNVEGIDELYQCIQKFLDPESNKDTNNTKYLDDFKYHLEGFEEKSNFDRVKLTQELGKAEIDGFTLIQHCALNDGLCDFLKALLDAYINPNEVLDGTTVPSNVNPCVLLAAEYGNSKILKVLIDYNNQAHSQEKNYLNVMNKGRGLKDVKSMMRFKKVECKFDRWTRDNETILHILLKRPLLKKLKDKYRHKSAAKSNEDFWNDLKCKAKKIDANYNSCIDVILSNEVDNGKFDDDDFCDTTDKQIKRIVNMQDKPDGNTPLHYAVHNWPQDVVTRLLRFGANVSVRNNDGNIPLKNISKETIEMFLDNFCLDIPKVTDIGEAFDTTDMGTLSRRKSAWSRDDSTVSIGPRLNEYQIGMLLDDYKTEMVAHSPVNFKFGFLSPAISEAQLSQASQNCWEFHVLRDKKFDLNSLKEMDVLTNIAESKDHRDLVLHPVLKAFTWIKWKLISKHYNRTLRVGLLLAFYLTWFIFDQFGGQRWSFSRALTKITSSKDDKSYRNVLDKRKYCPNFQEFNFFGNNSVISAVWDWRTSERGHDFFFLFVIVAVVLFVWMIIDNRDIFYCSIKAQRHDREVNRCKKIMYLLLSLSTDLGLITLMVLTFLGSEEVLWFNILVLTTMQFLREVLQFMSSVLEYFTQLDNYFDILQIVVIYVIVGVPNVKFEDTCRLSVAEDTDSYNKTCERIQKDALSHCTIKRCLAAWAIVSMWIRFIGKASQHPKLEKWSLYMTMFWQVAKTFFRFLFFYSTFIIAYALGFYIMLHHDYGKKNNGTTTTDSLEGSLNPTALNLLTRVKRKSGSTGAVPDGDDGGDDAGQDGQDYNVPMKSMMKTVVMFLGEIDDLPSRGGNITSTLAHLYLLTFLFLLVMVLMNLLNGMAVSDTGKILQRSQVLGQIGLIDTISYSESVLLNNLTTLQRIGRIRTLGRFGNLFLMMVQKILQSSGTMLFESDYMNGKEELILPFNTERGQTKIRFLPNTISNWIQNKFADDDIHDDVMCDARKIIEERIIEK